MAIDNWASGEKDVAAKAKKTTNRAGKSSLKDGRFRKGVSGNPKGRPKGSSDMGSVIGRVLKVPVMITENGRQRKITKKEALALQLVNKALQGDAKSMQHTLSAMRFYDERTQAPAPPASWAFTEDDQKVIEQVVDRILKSAPKESP